MTMSAYEALHDNSTAFGMKKAITAEATRDELKLKNDELSAEKLSLERELKDLRIRIHLTDRIYVEQKESDDKVHFERMQFLKRVNQLLKV